MIDGLKPGQRKTLFCSLARDWKTECKVSVLTAHAIYRSDYNHGEQILASTIIKMAQDYVGSSNVNLLLPMGQFGSQIFVSTLLIGILFSYLSKLLLIIVYI